MINVGNLKQAPGLATVKKAFAMKEAGVLLIVIMIGVILSVMSPYFFLADNFLTVLSGLACDGIIVVGETIALISGGFDLSVGSVMGLTAMSGAYLASFGMNIWIAVLISLVLGVLCGLLNGVFIGKIGINPFITTLAMMGIAGGGALLLTQGQSISLSGVSPVFLFLGQSKIHGIPFIVILFIVIAIVSDFVMRRSQPARKVFYIGSNEKAAVLSGINVTKIKISVYIISAFLASIAGILSLSRFGASTPTTGTGAELVAITAAVIGGASLNGGEGTIFGAVLGVILLNLVNNGLILMNVSVYGQDLISGLILLLAVTADHVSQKKRFSKTV